MGPLPASVYWRRRWVAIASVCFVLVMLVWTVAALAAPSDGTTTRAASRAAVSAPQQAPSSPAPPGVVPGTEGPAAAQPGPDVAPAPVGPTPGAPVPTPGTTAGGPSTTGPSGGPTTGPTTGPTSGPTSGPTTAATSGASTEQLVPDDTPRASPPVPPPAPVPATGPVPCTNAMLAVAAEVERPEHRVGDRALLRLVVTNTADQPCVRDLDPARQEIVVWSGDGADRLWSSNDCSTAAGVDLRTLVPGQPVAFSVRWVGRTSTPGCDSTRRMVPAGAYRVMTRVDDVISAPTPFRRNP